MSTAETLTGRLVDKVRSIELQDIPKEAIEVAKNVVLDGSSVILAGSTEPLGVGRLVTQWVKDMGGTQESSVIAGGFKVPAMSAAFANGTMAHALDFDNTSHPRNHPQSPTLSAILALAEKYSLPGDRVLGAIVIAFEIQARLRMASTGLDTGKGLHKPGTIGQMGGPAACAWLLGLSRQETLMALGIAGSRVGSLAINTGTMTKSSHSGHAARMTVESVELAKRGWTATDAVFDTGGYFDTFLGKRYEPELLVEDFGEPYRMVDPGIGYKKHPCNFNTQRAIDVALELRDKHSIDWRQIDSLVIEITPFDYINRPYPATGLDGKFSIQYTTSLALIDGIVTVDSFSDARRFSEDIVSFLPKVSVVYDDTIDMSTVKMLTRVRITMTDGTVHFGELEKMTGMVGIPLRREERERKFYGCALRVMSRGSADNLLSLIDGVGELDDIGVLMSALSNVDGGTATTPTAP